MTRTKRIIAIFSCFVWLNFSNAEGGAIVFDPTNAANTGTMVSHMVEALKQYEEMITKANEQINRLNQIGEFMNSTNKLISGSNLTIASPFEVLETLRDALSNIKNSYDRLSKTISDYDIKDHIKQKRLGAKCPWLRFDVINPKSSKLFLLNQGEETPELKDVKELLNLLSDNVYANYEATMGTLSGRALAELMCETVVEEEFRKQISNLTGLEKKAVIEGDQQAFNEARLKRMKIELEKKIKDQENLENKLQPLFQRVVQMKETLGVQDVSANNNKHGIKYCTKGKNDEGEFCYPILLNHTKITQDFNDLKQKLNDDLSGAGTDKDAQSVAYANFNQRGQMIMLEYLKDLSEGLSFLNETMSLTSSIIADDFKRKYQTSILDKPVNNGSYREESEILEEVKQPDLLQLKKVPLDKYGFPIIAPKKEEGEDT